jgi:hypothetical protein
MAANVGTPAQGLTLEWDAPSGDGATYVQITGATDVSGMDLTLVVKDVTVFGSGGFREQMPTLKQVNNLKFKIRADAKEAQQAQMNTDLSAATVPLRHFRVTFPDGGNGAAVIVGVGRLLKYEVTAKPDDILWADVEAIINSRTVS